MLFFFFSSRRRHTRCYRDWSSDVCSSDLAVLRAVGTDVDVSLAAFPFMTWRDGEVAGVPARLARVSFSGELAFEVHVAGWHGRHVWEALLEAGRPFGITPYGTGA